MVRGPRRGNSKEDNRMARKLAKMADATHGGYAGMSILEMLEEHLTECCTQYRVLKEALVTEPDENTPNRVMEARGRIRGLAISIAMMRHPLRRYEEPWWNYVKKLEMRHMQQAKDNLRRAG